MLTTASVFFQTFADAGITHVFVNWGNDHPAMLEDLERQRVENGKTNVEIVTCPNEMVALSAAQAYAQVAGKPAAVIVHVDVGTQALAGAVHNVDKGCAPVLIFAGASPFTVSGELRGSKNEWPMYPQDAPDQPAIVRQFMRFTAQVQSGKNAAKTIMRGLQFATSGPTGPVYLWARREVLEEIVDESSFLSKTAIAKWPSVQPAGLSPTALKAIASALMDATFPMIVTGASGRNTRTVPLLEELSNSLAISIYDSCPQSVNVSYSHPFLIGSSFDGRNENLQHADVALFLDAEIPFIEQTGTRLNEDARAFLIDADPLKHNVGWSHVDAEMICTADVEVALAQLLEALKESLKLAPEPHQHRVEVQERAKRVEELHSAYVSRLSQAVVAASPKGTPTAPFILETLRKAVKAQTPSGGEKVLWLNEATSLAGAIWNYIRPEQPGSMLMAGGASLGWSLPAGCGAQLGARASGKDYDLTVAIMGDGTYMFGIPTVSYWLARRYETPFLTIVLNNGGWASPKLSMLNMHPTGHGSKATMQGLSVGFGPDMPDYSGVARAAGGAWGRRVTKPEEIQPAIEEAIRVVLNEKRSACLDCIIDAV